MRKRHAKRTDNTSGAGKNTDKGTEVTGRQRAKIVEEPEKISPKK